MTTQTQTIQAAGVVFTPSVGNYYECADCGGLVSPSGTYGIKPEDHECSV